MSFFVAGPARRSEHAIHSSKGKWMGLWSAKSAGTFPKARGTILKLLRVSDLKSTKKYRHLVAYKIPIDHPWWLAILTVILRKESSSPSLGRDWQGFKSR